MMLRLGRYARKILLLKKTPSIRFSGTLTSPKLNDTLHSRVMAREGYRKVTPVLDEWLKNGNEINPNDLRGVINDLCESNRFIHALQVSEWISEGEIFNLIPEDFASRIYLVEIHSGLSEAEKLFKSIPENMKDDSVYTTLLSIYTKSNKTRHQAEATSQKMREQSMLSKPYPYYNMISLYGLLGERNMVDEILRQMKENEVEHDEILTANNVLKAYASVPDVEAMEKFLMEKQEEDLLFPMAWQTGICMAKAYLKTGLTKKAIEMLFRTELIVDTKSKDSANKVLMEMYRDAGAKEDESRLYRLIYPDSKKGERTRAYKSKGGGGGSSYYPGYYYDDGGDCGGGSGCGGGSCGGGGGGCGGGD